MSSIEAIIVTLIPRLNMFLSVAITLEATIQNNPTESWRFSREMSVMVLRYSETIFFGIRSNFTYDRSRYSSRQVLSKTGLQTCNFIKKRFQYRCFPVKFAKLLQIPFLPDNSSGYFCYDSETYDMIKLYLSVYLYLFLLYSSFFSV